MKYSTILPEPTPLEEIQLDKHEILIEVNEHSELVAIPKPSNADDTNILWESDNEEVAIVNETGIVTGISSGEARIAATSSDGSIRDVCIVKVKAHPESISLSDTVLTLSNIVDSYQLSAIILPENTFDKSVIWNSSNKQVCIISESGVVSATGVGTAVVTATTFDGGLTDSCVVTVIQNVTKVELNKIELLMMEGGTEQLSASIFPTDVENEALQWISSNDLIATVDASGNVTALKEGTAWIKAVSQDNPEAKDSCKVFVELFSPAIKFADPVVKTTCVTYWDSNGDGELSEAEASAVTSLGEVFKNKTEITSFDELKRFTGLQSIGSDAFYKCRNLESVEIPNGVTTISISAFEECTSLKELPLSNSIVEISSNAFKGCTSLTSLHIPSSVNIIYGGAYDGCSSLEEIIVDEGNNTYDSRNNCNAIIRTEDSYLMYGCKKTIIPNTIKHIGINAFRNCQDITEIIIPNSVTTIYGSAFYGCNNLSKVTLGNSVNSMGTEKYYPAFPCYNLSSVTVMNSSPISILANEFGNRQNITLNVPYGSKAAYEAADYWKDFKEIIEFGAPELVTYKLTYILDGVEYKSFDITEKEEIIPELNPTKEGYTFSGWSAIPETMPAHDVTVTGSFTANSYIVTYQVDGKEYKTSTVTYGTTLTPLTEPTKEGYTFSGWSEIPETMPARDVDITGRFTLNNYKLTYIVDGQTYKEAVLDYGTSISPEVEPAKEGYTFSGWGEIPQTMPAQDITVTGSFTANSYIVTYKIDGNEYKTSTVTYGSTLTVLTEPTKEGYTFSGWSEIPETMPARDMEITGYFTIKNYKLTYIVDGQTYKEAVLDYGSSISPEVGPAKEGYTFSGWSEIPETMPAKDVTVIGSFTINTYTITYLIDDEVYKTENAEYGTAINPFTAPNRNGYSFAWETYPGTVPAGDVTVVGHYIVKEKSITVEAARSTSAVLEAIGAVEANELAKLTIKGTINGYDVMAMRNRMPYLQFLDLSEAQIVANSYKYYENYATKDNVLTAYFVPRGIKEISLPQNLKNIDGSAFRDCAQLTSVTLPDNITSISSHTFDGCSALTDVKIPTSVASIGEYAFKGCESLTEIHLPADLEVIGDYAFEGCTSLKDVYAYMSDIVPIGQHTFNDYRNQSLHIPDFLYNKYLWDARWSQFQKIQTMELSPGDYDRFTTNTDTEMGADDQRIPHKEDGEAIDATIQREGSFTVEGDEPQDFATVELVNDGEGRSGSLIGEDNGEEQGNVVVDDLVYRVSVEAETEFQYTPPVDLNIDEDFEYPEGQYKWWYFDGSDRARLGSSGRKPLDGKILKAHQGYVFMAQRTGILVIHLGKTAVGGDRTTELQDYEAEEAQNQGWNFMGNPYASYYDMSECTNTSPVTVWNAAQLIYEALRPGDDDFYLQPFQSFYVQKQDEVKGLKFDAVSRKSYRKSVEEKEERRALRRAKGVESARRIVDLYIEVQEQQADRTRIVVNPSAKSSYEVGTDAAKFMSEKAQAQIYTIESGVEMAINERPMSGNMRLGYTSAKVGRLTIGASRMDAPLVLVDRQTGVTCDLSENAYEFTTTEGTFNDRFLIRAQGDDGIGALAEKTGVLIAIREGGLAIGGAEGKEIQVYSIDGKAVASQSGNGFISLKQGIYVVGVDGITAKVRIRE